MFYQINLKYIVNFNSVLFKASVIVKLSLAAFQNPTTEEWEEQAGAS